MDGSNCNGTHCRAGKPTAIFDTAIADAERLLELFDKLSKPEQQANEVLKRAALVMTLTAWETFIESWFKISKCLKHDLGIAIVKKEHAVYSR